MAVLLFVVSLPVWADMIGDLEKAESGLGIGYSDKTVIERISFLEEQLGIDAGEKSAAERMIAINTELGLLNNIAETDTEEMTVSDTVSAAKQIIDALGDGDYTLVINLYKEEVKGNIKREDEVVTLLRDKLKEDGNAFAEGRIKDKDYELSLEMMGRVDEELQIISEELEDAYSNYEEIVDSRNMYNEGVESFELKDYKNAVRAFSLVSPIDTVHYDKAQQKLAEASDGYANSAIRNAKDYIKEGDVKTALGTLDEAEEILGEKDILAEARLETLKQYKEQLMQRSVTLLEKGNVDETIKILEDGIGVLGENEELNALLTEAYTKNFETEVENTILTGDIKEILLCLEKAQLNPKCVVSSEIEGRINEIVASYKESAVSEANTCYLQSGCIEAIGIINDALAVLPDDVDLLNAKDYFVELMPVCLSDMQAFYSDYTDGSGVLFLEGCKIVNAVLNDKLGNTYNNCIEYFGGMYNQSEARDVYLLQKKYATFMTVILVPDTRSEYWDNETSDTKKSSGAFTLRIWGDNELLYQSPFMASTVYPQLIELDVSGVEQLSINWQTYSDIDSEIGLAEPCLYKDGSPEAALRHEKWNE